MAELLGLLTMCKIGFTSANQIRSILSDSEMAKILSELGDLDSKAALLALGDRERSNNPKREASEAITHLRSAYLKFISSSQERRFFGIWPASLDTRCEMYRKAIESLILMSFCYKYLGEPDNCLEHLKEARKIFVEYYSKELGDHLREIRIKCWEDHSIEYLHLDMELSHACDKELEELRQEECFLNHLIESVER
jgi:hypothetical protein